MYHTKQLTKWTMVLSHHPICQQNDLFRDPWCLLVTSNWLLLRTRPPACTCSRLGKSVCFPSLWETTRWRIFYFPCDYYFTWVSPTRCNPVCEEGSLVSWEEPKIFILRCNIVIQCSDANIELKVMIKVIWSFIATYPWNNLWYGITIDILP